MSISYISMIVAMYVAVRFMQIIDSENERKSLRVMAGIFLVCTLVLAWNIVAVHKYNFEDWKSYGSKTSSTIIDDLGIEGEILKK